MYPLPLGEAQYIKWRKIEIGAQSLLFMCNEVQLIQFKKESPCHNLRDFVFEMVESPGISIRSHVRFMKPGFPLIFTYFTLNMKWWNEKKETVSSSMGYHILIINMGRGVCNQYEELMFGPVLHVLCSHIQGNMRTWLIVFVLYQQNCFGLLRCNSNNDEKQNI